MRGSRSAGWATLRAAIAVVALYALVLHAFLGGVLAADLAGPAHTLCLQAAGSPGDGTGAPLPAHAHLPCCTAAHASPTAPAPPPAQAAVARPVRRVVALAWRAEVVAVPRAPPRALAQARGPPVA